MNAYFLSQLLACQWNTVAICILVDVLLVVLVLFNPYLAWSNANKMDDAPKWVKDRVKPLTEEQSQKWDAVESFGSKIFGNN